MANINEAFYKEILPDIQALIEEESVVYYLVQEYSYYGPTGLSVAEGKVTAYRWTDNETLQVQVDRDWMDAEDIYLTEEEAIVVAREWS